MHAVTRHLDNKLARVGASQLRCGDLKTADALPMRGTLTACVANQRQV